MNQMKRLQQTDPTEWAKKVVERFRHAVVESDRQDDERDFYDYLKANYQHFAGDSEVEWDKMVKEAMAAYRGKESR